jgi:methylated-DNA-[protein]-cysteine S-methyltransferase
MEMAAHDERFIASPVGTLQLVAGDEALLGVHFTPKRAPAPRPERAASDDLLNLAERELNEYFAGRRTRFSMPLAPRGTDFQRSVWRALEAIPFGETRSYADIAAAVGRPRAVRAVGAANGLNPIAIVIPCHRVIGADGTLTGYGGGLDNKRWLLTHEHRLADAPLLRLG